MRRRAPSTLAEAIRGAIVRAVMMTAALVLGYDIASSHLVIVTRPPSTERPTVEASPADALAEAADRGLACWQGPAPRRFAEAVPTHVVWQHVGGRTVVSSRLVGPALETLFADGTLEGRAVAFCHTDR